MIQILHFSDPGFADAFRKIEERGETAPVGVVETVQAIIADVRARGDQAVFDYTARFDRLELSAATVEVQAEEIDRALAAISAESRAALELAAKRIADYHRKQKQETWISTDEEDVLLGHGAAARPGRHLRSRRQGRLSVFGADERRPRQGRWSNRGDHGRADARRRGQSDRKSVV